MRINRSLTGAGSDADGPDAGDRHRLLLQRLRALRHRPTVVRSAKRHGALPDDCRRESWPRFVGDRQFEMKRRNSVVHRKRTDMASPVGRTAGLARAWSRPSAAVLERDVLTGVSMAFVGGFVDAAGFMALAGLFTSHVTGNFVLIGDQLAAGTGGVVAKLAALPIFVLAVGGARLVALATERRKIATMRPLLLLEASLLSAFLLAGMVLSPLRFPDSIEAIFVGMLAVAAPPNERIDDLLPWNWRSLRQLDEAA